MFAFLYALQPISAHAGTVGYSITITTAYATSNPFPNRLDQAFTEPDTGFVQIANSGNTTFTGTVGTIAVSADAGDLSYTSGTIVLMPGNAVSIAIPYDSSDVGGFNGPAYLLRPGVEVTMNGTMSDGFQTQPIALLVADADIHSGVWRTDPRGLLTDSFVLQGGDPWGFDTGDAFELSQANGVYVFSQAGTISNFASVPEPGSSQLLLAGVLFCLCVRMRSVSRPFPG